MMSASLSSPYVARNIKARSVYSGRSAQLKLGPPARPQLRAARFRVYATYATAEESYAMRIEHGLVNLMGQARVSRVVDSLRRLNAGEEFHKEWPEYGVQQSGSYIDGLEAIPYHDPQRYPWAVKLEEKSGVVIQELREVLAAEAGEVWSAAAREEAVAYGPNWRTLVLQDRGRWDSDNTRFFPKTAALVKECGVPSVEVFFAKQDPHTGIAAHTDSTNFILSGHLGLIIPDGDCWIQVGHEKRSWEEGKALVMDTSFMHETYNNTDDPRYVLLFRCWHPGTTKEERAALQFIFDCLDGEYEDAEDALKKTLKKQLPNLVAEVERDALKARMAAVSGGRRQPPSKKKSKKGKGRR